MRYKALAIRLCQAAGVADPTPTSTLLIPTDFPFDALEEGRENYSADNSHDQAEVEVEAEAEVSEIFPPETVVRPTQTCGRVCLKRVKCV